MATGPVARRFGTQVQSPGFWLRSRREYGIRIINKTGSSIAANKLVAVSGYDVTSKHIKVVLADADAANLSTDVWVTKAAIADGAKATVYKGFLSPATLDTSGVTTVGDPVYLDTTAGAFTATAPSAGNATLILVGFTTVKSSTVGQIHWDIQPPQKISSLQIQGGQADSTIFSASGTIASADITGTGAGQLGHANGVILVPVAAAGKINQFISAIVTNTFAVAAYGGGGNTTINIGAGGAALSGLAANTVIITNAATATIEFVPLAATKNVYTTANPLNLVTASAPTQPGTAAGTISWHIYYRTVSIP